MQITLKQAAQKIQAANKILVTAHILPDGDAVGSTLAMLQILRSIGKSAQVFIDDTVRANLHALPHFDEIRRPAADEKFDADLLLILDTEPGRIGNVRNLTDAPILNIDHHVTNSGEDYDLYLEHEAAATCEIVFDFARELGAEITLDVATCIYTGIATDTGFFQYSNTRAKTLRTVSELVTCGVRPNEISEQLEKKSLAEVRDMCRALQSARIYFSGKVAGIFLTRAESTEGFIDLIRVINGVDVAFMINEKAPNFCRVSMRSKGVDVATIADSLGGGGHVRAAGCTLKTSIDEATKILVAAIGKALHVENPSDAGTLLADIA
ncbi:MAG: bifunctional oligoribonuclease/PAP phosphatase NrnA [Selenomonadaceae bacterium]|nr:bifunctional oligoribonuclease/PAP phosphatase NrnA [Selenomonadaceae bacterium]